MFIDDMMLYKENPKHTIKKLLCRTCQSIQQNHKIQNKHTKSEILYSNNYIAERENRKEIAFTIAVIIQLFRNKFNQKINISKKIKH